MRALLLAAGMGTRLRPLTDTIPKCLVPIHGRPLLGYWLTLLFDAGFERVLINTHYLASLVEEFVRNSEFSDHVDLVYEPTLLGTGGTILANKSYFGSEDFLIAHADNLTDFDVRAFVAKHQQRPADCAMTMLSFETDDPQSCGILDLNSEGVVIDFHEKVENPPGNNANAAVYLVSEPVVSYLQSIEAPFLDFSTQVIPKFIGRILSHLTHGYHRDIGNIESLRLAELEFKAPQDIE